MQNLPRHIDPSLISVGDKVRIELPKNQGVVHTVEGTIHSKDVSGGVTYYYTAEGGNILAYYKEMQGIRVLLISREDKQAPIFSDNFWKTNNEDVFAETNDRIA